MMKQNSTLLLVAIILILGCTANDAERWSETDLMSHGLPLKIEAPADLEVTRSLFSGSEEFKLSGAKGYGMNVLVLEATTDNESLVKSELESLVERGKYFNKFVESENNGFVYQITIDSLHSVFGFRKVKIQGGKQFVFQNPYMSRLTEEEAKKLYNSIPN
jgi:hypothetical protein